VVADSELQATGGSWAGEEGKGTREPRQRWGSHSPQEKATVLVEEAWFNFFVEKEEGQM
jgi:hypothetical protein